MTGPALEQWGAAHAPVKRVAPQQELLHCGEHRRAFIEHSVYVSELISRKTPWQSDFVRQLLGRSFLAAMHKTDCTSVVDRQRNALRG